MQETSTSQHEREIHDDEARVCPRQNAADGVGRRSRIVQDDGDAQQPVGSELIQDSQQVMRAVTVLEKCC